MCDDDVQFSTQKAKPQPQVIRTPNIQVANEMPQTNFWTSWLFLNKLYIIRLMRNQRGWGR